MIILETRHTCIMIFKMFMFTSKLSPWVSVRKITDISLALFLGESLLRHIPIRKLINLFHIPPCLFRKFRRVAVKVNDTPGTFRHYGGISLAAGWQAFQYVLDRAGGTICCYDISPTEGDKYFISNPGCHANYPTHSVHFTHLAFICLCLSCHCLNYGSREVLVWNAN